MHRLNIVRSRTAGIASFLLAGLTAGSSLAAEIKLLYPTALAPVFRELLPEFERGSLHRVTAQYGPAGAIAARVRKGEAADVAIVTTAQSTALSNEGKAVAGSRVEFARVGVGVYVPKGAAKPDIASLASFKSAIIGAKSIAQIDPASDGASGIYVAGLFERLGLAAEIRPKLRLFPAGAAIFFAVARGEVELAFGQISEILSHPDVDLAGPLPADIQNYTRFAAVIVAGSKNADAGAALVRFVSSPAAKAAMHAKGFEP